MTDPTPGAEPSSQADGAGSTDPTAARLSERHPALTAAAIVAATGVLLLGIAALRMTIGRAPSSPAPAIGEAVQAPVRSDDSAAGSSADQAAPPEVAPSVDGGAGASDPAAALSKELGPAWQVVRVVEDWRNLGASDPVEEWVALNLGIGDNELALMPLTSPPAPGALGGLLGSWRIDEPRPEDFVGFDRDLDPPQAWTGGEVLALWLDTGERPRGNVVLQFREGGGSGEVWRYQGGAAAVPASGPLLLPLDEQTFTLAPWSGESDGLIGLDTIDRYGFYVGHAGAEISGGFMLGAIAVLRPLTGD